MSDSTAALQHDEYCFNTDMYDPEAEGYMCICDRLGSARSDAQQQVFDAPALFPPIEAALDEARADEERQQMAHLLSHRDEWIDDGRLEGMTRAREIVTAIHAPFGIYDECECPEPIREQDGHLIEMEYFTACEESLLYWVCRECCTENGYHTEHCATEHNHGLDKPYCVTVAALDALVDSSSPNTNTEHGNN